MKQPDLMNYISSNLDLYHNLDKKILNHLYFDLSRKIYEYGNHFTIHKRNYFRKFVTRSGRRMLLNSKQLLKAPLKGNGVLCNAYFHLENVLGKLGCEPELPPWSLEMKARIFGSAALRNQCLSILHRIQDLPFNQILTPAFFDEIKECRQQIKQALVENSIKAVFFPSDILFFESLTIDICKELKIPSFVYIHGLPAGYEEDENKHADYLIVWGNQIKANYIDQGMKPEQIIVTGHPKYGNYPSHIDKPDLSQVVVLGKAAPGAFIPAVNLPDRGNLILYAELIKEALIKVGVKHAIFRPHPSMNKEFYQNFLDLNFYTLDNNQSITQTIKNSSLMIGPTSTVSVEALMMDKNYYFFEPRYGDKDICNYRLGPPFNGHYNHILLANSTEQLVELLRQLPACDIRFLKDHLNVPQDWTALERLLAR